MPTITSFVFRIQTLFLALLFFVAGFAVAQSDESALKMVKELRLGQNLGAMSYRMAKITTTYQGVAAKVGVEKADELLRAELAISVPKHQDQWDKNLAKAWAPLMARAEFESITAEKQKSPYAAKFTSLQNQAGTAMRADSEKLLSTVIAEALNNVFDKSVAKK